MSTGADDSTVRIPAKTLKAVVSRLFSAVGMSGDDANLMAETLVASDQRGVPSHGVLHVGGYLQRLTSGGVDPRGQPKVIRRKAGALRVDGGNSMGQIGGAFAMREAIAAAADNGIAFSTVGNSNHCGALAWYAMQALAHHQIGIAFTNAMPTMAPWNSRDRILGINPFAVAVPVANGPPFVLDISFSAASRSKIVVYHQTGHELAEGWALDASGRPTRDPAEALNGLLLPIGGHKGTGLALVSGILSTMLSGAECGPGLGSVEEGAVAGADGHAFMALDIAAFEETDVFDERMGRLVASIRDAAPAEGADRVTYPGERAEERLTDACKNGVPVSRTTVLHLIELCREFNVDANGILPS